MRAQSPAMEEAYRKLSLALIADGYTLETANPTKHELATGWRALKEIEESASNIDQRNGGQSRIEVKMSQRGRLYNVVIIPMLRYGGGAEQVAGAHHPLMEKWQRIVRTLLENEYREED